MVQPSDLLTIQKFIFLLDDFHFAKFVNHLQEIKAELPLKLSQIIRKELPEFDNHEELCKKVYGRYDKNDRLAFNQLASYTFKLSSNLAVNYPAYLTPNYPSIQRLVNEGNTTPANFLSKILLEIAEKTEDFATQIFVLKFLIQQAFLMKQSSVGVKLSYQLDSVYDIEKKCNEVLSALRLHLNVALETAVNPERLSDFKKMFLSYHQHSSAALRLLSKYGYLYAIYYHEPEQFRNSSTDTLIQDLEKDLNNCSYIVFPFAFDFKSNFSFYKLNSPSFNSSTKPALKEFEELKKHYNSVKFWKSYLNIPEIFAMALKASNHLTKYHHFVHRSDYFKLVPADDMKDIKEMIQKCREMLSHEDLEKNYKNDLINLELLYSGLLILSGGNGIKEGADELEAMLISYQQINLAGTTDSIFLFLIIAYFAMRNYEKCAQTFKRYTRITKGKTVYDDNDIEIHVYYYLSQWLAFRSKQYLVKLKGIYTEVNKNQTKTDQVKAIEELASYFNLDDVV